LLGIGEICQSCLILDFLLNDLLLEIRAVKFAKGLCLSSRLLRLRNNLHPQSSEFSFLIADADFAFDFLRFQRLKTAPSKIVISNGPLRAAKVGVLPVVFPLVAHKHRAPPVTTISIAIKRHRGCRRTNWNKFS